MMSTGPRSMCCNGGDILTSHECHLCTQDNPNVIIAKMDATKNDIPDSRVSLPGYPTLVWFPSQKARAPVYYPGGRSLEELQHFVQQQLVSVEKEKEESSPNAAAGGGAEMKEHDGTNDRDEL